MILGIGCDLVEHQTIRDLEWESDKEVLQQIFSIAEMELYDKLKELRFLAGRFAIKEAIVKCLKTGMIDGISLKDIQTTQAENGLPELRLSGEIKVISEQMNINHWHITISHSSSYTIAFVIGEHRAK